MARALWCCSLLSAAAVAAEPPPELMERLAEWADRTDPAAVAAVTLTTLGHERELDGALAHTDESVARITRGPDGRPVSEVIWAKRDGRDTTAEARKKSQDSEKEARRLRRVPTPFTSAEQPKYTFELLPPFPDDPAMVHLAFRPRGKPEAGLYLGDAKVDPASGSAVWIQQRSSKLPAFVDELAIELDLRTPSAHGPLVSTVRLKGMAGFAFFKKRFDVELRFSDYQFASTPPAAPPAGAPP